MSAPRLTLLILTGSPASGKTLLANALTPLGAVRLPIGSTARGREGVCIVETNHLGPDTDRMVKEWRENGAAVHIVEMRRTIDDWTFGVGR